MLVDEPQLKHLCEKFDELFSGGQRRVTPVPVSLTRDDASNAVLQKVAGAVCELLAGCAKSWRGVGSVGPAELGLFLARIDLVALLYGDDKTVMSYCMLWGADACVAAGDWAKSWRYFQRQQWLNLRGVVNRLPRAGAELTAEDLLAILASGSGLTDFARKHLNEVTPALSVSLRSYVAEHGTDPIRRVHGLFDYDHMGPDALATVEALYDSAADFEVLARCHLEEAERRRRHGDRCSSMYERRERLFSGLRLKTDMVGGKHLPLAWVGSWTDIPTLVQGAMNSEARRVVRTAENLLREQQGFPNVGEGWVQETALLRLVKGEWPHLRVVHHGRPTWLGRQHLDVWLPDVNVAIEYQGAQHQAPVGHFGGEQGFRETRRRDLRKAQLCRENGCRLLYVTEEWEWPAVKNEIESAIQGDVAATLDRG